MAKKNKKQMKNKIENKKLSAIGSRVGFSAAVDAVEAVDEEALTLKGVCICKMGEALGHEVWLDEEFINGVYEQGKDTNKGLICHFGHSCPNGERIKDYMGFFENFEIKDSTDHEGNPCKAVFADITFSETAAAIGDNVKWVLGLAKERPDALALSIVFAVGDYKIKTVDGDLTWEAYMDANGMNSYWNEFMAASTDGKVYVVLGKLYGADFVAEGAATDGLFQKGNSEMKPEDEKKETVDEVDEVTEAAEENKDGAPAEDETAAEDVETKEDEKPASDDEAVEASDDEEVKPAEDETAAEPEKEEDAPAAEEEAPAEEKEDEASDDDGDEEKKKEEKPAEDVEAAAEELSAAEQMKKRLAGFQSMHDKKMREMNLKLEKMTEDLAKAKADATSFQHQFEEMQKEFMECHEQLEASKTRFAKLTGSALTIGEAKIEHETMRSFLGKHNNSLSEAVKADPETYKRICGEMGIPPYALMNK